MHEWMYTCTQNYFYVNIHRGLAAKQQLIAQCVKPGVLSNQSLSVEAYLLATANEEEVVQ